MKHISIGGLDISRIGLGAMSMSGYYNIGAVNDAESIRTIHRALELGVTHLDTAEIYGPYTNEKLVGRAIKGRRDWRWRKICSAGRTSGLTKSPNASATARPVLSAPRLAVTWVALRAATHAKFGAKQFQRDRQWVLPPLRSGRHVRLCLLTRALLGLEAVSVDPEPLDL